MTEETEGEKLSNTPSVAINQSPSASKDTIDELVYFTIPAKRVSAIKKLTEDIESYISSRAVKGKETTTIDIVDNFRELYGLDDIFNALQYLQNVGKINCRED